MLQSLHHPVYHTPRLREMRHLYWAHGLTAFSMGLSLLLIPAYLLTIGYSLPNVFLFFIILFAAAIPFSYISAALASQISPNRLMAVGNVFCGLFFVTLLLMPVLDIPLWFPPLLKAVDKGLYWPAFHLSFSKSRLHKKADSQVGAMNAVVILTFGIAPAVGGVVASLADISWVYGLGAVMLAASAVTILTGRDVITHRPFNPRLLSKRVIPDLLANASFASTFLADTIIWPLVIFLLVKSYAGIGVLGSVVVLSSAVVAYVVGKRADRRGERHYVKEGSWVAAITNALRLVAASALHVFGINLLGGVSQSLLGTSLTARYYKHADREPRLEYIWAMETSHLVGWVVLLSVGYVLASVLPTGAALSAVLILAIPLSFGVRLMR